MENETMSEREIRLAAEMGKPVEASKQNKILEEAKERTRKRVEELNRMKAEEEARKAEEERIANEPPMSKRQRQRLETQTAEINNSNYRNIEVQSAVLEEDKLEIDTNKAFLNEKMFSDNANYRTMPNEIVRDLKQPIKVDSIVKFKPSEINNRFKKIKVDKIPSHFLSYPKNAEIYITPYSGDDIDELSNSQLSLKYILTKALEGIYTNFDKKQITFYDLVYLSFYRRILSINENKIRVMSQCPYCGKFSTHEIEIDKQLDFEEVKIPTLPVNIDFSFGRLSFTFLTYENYMKLETELRSEELAYQCVTDCEIDTEAGQTRESELQKLFGNLVGEDQALIVKLREILYHGVKPINTLCQNTECGKTYETILDEMNAVLIPFFPSTKDYRTKVSFG